MRPRLSSVSRRGRLAGLAGAAALAAGALIGAGPSYAVSVGPTIDQHFPDPDVIQVGGTYYAYATNSDDKHIIWATSTDLTTWSVQSTDALPVLGAWADPTVIIPAGSTKHGVWAPEVFATGPDSYVMWYTAHDRASDRQCIGAATATAPGGPFTPLSTALVCTPATGGAIDASSFVENGRRYLLWKDDGNCCALDTWLRIQEVSADGLSRIGTETRLLKQDKPFEGGLVEAPVLWKHGSTYVLFYSANNFAGDRYATGYARSASLLGPYTKAAVPLMTTDAFAGTVRGPGGQDIVIGPDGRDRIVFHGWNSSYGYRAMYSRELGWADDQPVVRGAKVRYEAESAAATDVVTRTAAGASGGRAVGEIDGTHSRVTFTVYAPRTGGYRLHTLFGNGSLGGVATHQLIVNGAAAGTVRYPVTGWDNWQISERDITLDEGWNTITYTMGTNVAELDAIDVA
jgi:arabinan endo-1,5-alpha-L-arabinosidase